MRIFPLHVALLFALVLLSCRPAVPPPDPDNELPFGYVDVPRNRSIVGREVEVSGWAMDDSRVAEVRLFVDGRYKASAMLNVPRPDVSKAHPKYAKAGDLHGWRALVDLGEEVAHTIVCQAVDDRGATRDIGSAAVKVIGR